MQQDDAQGAVMTEQLSTQVMTATRRFFRLQEDTAAVTRVVMAAREKMQEGYSLIVVEQKALQTEIDELRSELLLLSGHLTRLSAAFRFLLKQDSFSALQTRIDALPIEALMTRQEFSALIEKELSSPRP